MSEENELMHHLKVKKGDIGKYVILDYSGVLRAIIPDLRSQCSGVSRPT